jgi:hypothetical protein
MVQIALFAKQLRLVVGELMPFRLKPNEPIPALVCQRHPKA